MPATNVKPIAEPESKRFRCRHIFTDGRRCASPSLRHEDFCYYHHNTRRPAPRCPGDSTPRGRRNAAITLPNPEDRSAIQHAIGQVLIKLANNEIDPRRAGLLLYGLQIASKNLPKDTGNQQAYDEDTVEEITVDPVRGALAPPAGIDENRPKSTVRRLIEDFERRKWEQEQEEEDEEDEPFSLHAAAAPATPRTPEPWTLSRILAVIQDESQKSRGRFDHQKTFHSGDLHRHTLVRHLQPSWRQFL